MVKSGKGLYMKSGVFGAMWELNGVLCLPVGPSFLMHRAKALKVVLGGWGGMCHQPWSFLVGLEYGITSWLH